jgi:ribosomal RNA-processing protein 9
MRRSGPKRAGGPANGNSKKAKKDTGLQWEEDEELGSEDEDDNRVEDESEEEEEDDDDETADEKRIRLAKQYLAQLDEEEAEEEDEEGDLPNRVADRLHKEALQAADRLFNPMAASLKGADLAGAARTVYRGHQVRLYSSRYPH